METTAYKMQGRSSREEGPGHSGKQRRRCFQEANPILAHLPEPLQRRLDSFSSFQAHLVQFPQPLQPWPLLFLQSRHWAFFIPKRATITGQPYNLSFKLGHFGERKRMLLIHNPGQLGLSRTDTNMWSLYCTGPATGPLRGLLLLFLTHPANLP